MEKRVYKSVKDRKVFGVCGGLGEYFNIDPMIFRLGFVVLVLAFGIQTSEIITTTVIT